MGLRGHPGNRRIKTELFLGISIASSRFSEIPKQRNGLSIKYCKKTLIHKTKQVIKYKKTLFSPVVCLTIPHLCSIDLTTDPHTNCTKSNSEPNFFQFHGIRKFANIKSFMLLTSGQMVAMSIGIVTMQPHPNPLTITSF
jgi:hypothetical protein